MGAGPHTAHVLGHRVLLYMEGAKIYRKGWYTVIYRLQEVLHNRFGFVFPNLVLRLGGIFLGHLFKLGFDTL